MDHSPKAAAEPDPKSKPDLKSKPFSFPNGVLRKHHLRPGPASDDDCLYRECLKNHAASLGGHALDGCGEFMLAPTADPADPASLRCAACGCHRNFHRRIPDRRRREGAEESDGDGEEGEDEDEDGDDEEIDRGRSSASPPPFYSSVPHMLLALSGSLHAGPGPIPLRPVATPIAAVAAAPVGAPASEQPKKRFRTKFTPEQKERMQALSQRLGWRMQKRDEGIVEECCREIGVDKGVFKVWMHNNKHAFLGLGRRGETGGDRGGVGVGGAAGGADVVRTEGNGGHSDDNGVVGGGGGGDGDGDGDGDGGGDGNGHTANGSPYSSS